MRSSPLLALQCTAQRRDRDHHGLSLPAGTRRLATTESAVSPPIHSHRSCGFSTVRMIALRGKTSSRGASAAQARSAIATLRAFYEARAARYHS
jgi:hypothetical protein